MSAMGSTPSGKEKVIQDIVSGLTTDEQTQMWLINLAHVISEADFGDVDNILTACYISVSNTVEMDMDGSTYVKCPVCEKIAGTISNVIVRSADEGTITVISCKMCYRKTYSKKLAI